MADKNASIAARWAESPTAQGAALGAVLGPVGALLAYLFSSTDKRSQRTFAALKGSFVSSVVILLIAGLVVLAINAF